MVKVRETHVECEDVAVEFDDGVKVVFKPYKHGFGYQIEGLHSVIFSKEDKIICKINSRLYRCGPSDDEHKVAFISSELTQEKIAEYWEKAKNFVIDKFYPKGMLSSKTDDKYWYQWVVVAMEGYFDLQDLKAGKMKLSNIQIKV